MKIFTDVFFEQVSSQKVMVVGDVMLDEYHYCHVDRISPEAPVPVCAVQDTSYIPGGAANVAANIHALGAKVHLVGIYGVDGSGSRLQEALQSQGIDTSYLLQSQSSSTTLKSRIVSKNQHIVRVDRDMSTQFSDVDIQYIKQRIKTLISSMSVIIFSDYAKGVLSDDVCQFVIKLARQKKIPVVVDPKGDSYLKYQGASVIKPNAKEFELLFRSIGDCQSDTFKCAQKICQQGIFDAILLTRSEKGMTLFTSETSSTIPTEAKEISDVTGAGDTVVAFFSLAYGMGLSLLDAAMIANKAAGLAVSKFGTSIIPLKEFKKLFIKEPC